jgi:predicted lipoprotein with Yx(FWY)xxD motif
MMRHPRITIAAVAIGAAGAIGGIALAAGGSSSSYGSGASSSSSGSVSPLTSSAQATVHAETATVQGKSEMILVDANGLPLYTFKGDSPTKSAVAGQLAVAWPALVSNAPTANGVMGTLTTVSTGNGKQVAYNGHFLYTFVKDQPGHVTGQGVANFLVATPSLAWSGSAAAASAPSQSSNGWSY